MSRYTRSTAARAGGAALLTLALALGGTPLDAQECAPPDTSAPWARVALAWRDTSHEHWTNDSLRLVLLRLAEEDQSVREAIGARLRDSAYVRRQQLVDSALADAMSAILDRFGLPTRNLVGAAGSDAAMLVVQHNDRLQERVLALAGGAPAGQISPEALALLEDLVRVRKGEPQRFGSQFTVAPDGRLRFAPVSDPATLDARRARLGLMPMAQYVCLLEASGFRIDRASLPALDSIPAPPAPSPRPSASPPHG
jgi:hypothetical protein